MANYPTLILEFCSVIMCMFMMCSIIGCAVQPPTDKTEWGYETENGPEVWGQLKPEYILCAEGKHQSPINIVNATLAELPALPHTYNSSIGMDIRNNGHTIEVTYPEGSWIEVDGTRYQLLQFHFHAPSEHTVAGKLFDIEMHLVHKSEAGDLAVLGVFIESGGHNPAFEPVWEHLPSVPGETQHVAGVTIDLRHILSPIAEVTEAGQTVFPNYYRYDGSLTTPPCSEGVKWSVLTTPLEMSETQILAFKAIIHDNNRPVQPLNGRKLLQRRGK